MKQLHHSIYYAAVALLGLAACQGSSEEGYTTTESGLKFKYINETDNPMPDSANTLLMHMVYRTEDSVLFPAPGQEGPVPVPLMGAPPTSLVYEAFGMMKKGDSAHFQVTPQELFTNTFGGPIPPFIDSTDMITFEVGVSEVMSEEEFQAYRMEMMRKQQEDMIAMMAEQNRLDSATIAQYLEENNINAEATESGLRYQITKKGRGVQPAAGDSVFVNYRGTLLNGTEFDSSAERGPFGFVLGQQQVIAGWDEGIALLNEGGKAMLYVPSPLAYGPQARSEVIGENAILAFDVELVDVKSN